MSKIRDEIRTKLLESRVKTNDFSATVIDDRWHDHVMTEAPAWVAEAGGEQYLTSDNEDTIEAHLGVADAFIVWLATQYDTDWIVEQIQRLQAEATQPQIVVPDPRQVW